MIEEQIPLDVVSRSLMESERLRGAFSFVPDNIPMGIMEWETGFRRPPMTKKPPEVDDTSILFQKVKIRKIIIFSIASVDQKRLF